MLMMAKKMMDRFKMSLELLKIKLKHSRMSYSHNRNTMRVKWGPKRLELSNF